MNKAIKNIHHPVIYENGRPVSVLVPIDEYLDSRQERAYTYVPEAVGEAVLDGMSPLKAWREFKKLTQEEMGQRMKISREAYRQMEAAQRPRKATLLRAAQALSIDQAQLLDLY
jgi:DNA-binding XRE family transcriptional regulator